MGNYYNIEVYNNSYSIYKAKSISFSNIINTDEKKHIQMKKTIKNRKLNIVILGENIEINKLKLSKLNYKSIDKVIKNTLRAKFRNIEDILYDYAIYEDNIVIYVVNGIGIKEIKGLILKNKIIQIRPIQFTILEELRESIKLNKYILIAKHGNYIYLLKVDNNVLVENHIREVNSVEDEKSNIKIILEFETKINDRDIYLYGIDEVVNSEIIENFENVKVI